MRLGHARTLTPADMKLHYGDLTDSTCLVKIISEVKPTEIYNLGAQSHVKVSGVDPRPPGWTRPCSRCPVLGVRLRVWVS